jgi:FMN phosphatase YigB (HAD superfamily)
VALDVTQRPAEECIFIDDRSLNLESPRRLGMHVIQYQDPEQLRSELRSHGVDV